jgi:hypothetical protein
LRSIPDNAYAYPYNPPGFECAFTIKSFPDYFDRPNEQIDNWIRNQIDNCYDFDEDMHTKRASDPLTCAARLYEATRLDNLTIEL